MPGRRPGHGLPSAPARGRIVAAIIGPSDESGPSTRIREGPSSGVPDEAEDRRVEAGDGRQPGQLGIGHPLGHENGRQHQASHQVLG